MAKYKVGDKVIVRRDLVVGQVYEMETGTYTDTFEAPMRKFAGQEVTISEVIEKDSISWYHLKEDVDYWAWVDEMFEDKNPLISEECAFQTTVKT
jgi:hypothetical protein